MSFEVVGGKPLHWEHLIRKDEDGSLPFGDMQWTERQAVEAAKYNSSRWGPHVAVKRLVTPWEDIREEV